MKRSEADALRTYRKTKAKEPAHVELEVDGSIVVFALFIMFVITLVISARCS